MSSVSSNFAACAGGLASASSAERHLTAFRFCSATAFLEKEEDETHLGPVFNCGDLM